MKILKFDGKIGDVSAFRIENGKKTHYNIKWGTYAKKGWSISFGVSDKIVDDFDNKEIVLSKSDYTLMPITDDEGEYKRDKKGNVLYYINRRYNYNDGSVLLFVNLSKWAGKQLDFRISPSVTMVAKCIDVININGNLITTPSYVILMTEGSEAIIDIGPDDNRETIKLKVKNGNIKE